MSILSCGNFEKQIDMFFQVYDIDNNGELDYDEVRKLCKLQLHFASNDYIVEYLAETFAKLLFDMAGVEKEQSISIDQLKKTLAEHNERSLIEMFCSFNFFT